MRRRKNNVRSKDIINTLTGNNSEARLCLPSDTKITVEEQNVIIEIIQKIFNR